MRLRNIEILESDNNKKGDLFGRLIGDLFHTLGYDQPRMNIHKAGREIDLESKHRTEKKIAIGECKAHAEKIGGADINKFVGILDIEKRKLKKDKLNKDFSVIGYFVSLSGFKETAIEQENESGNKRVILIKPEKLIEELIKGRIIVSIEKAISSLKNVPEDLILANTVDLLATDKGWIWAIYYSDCNGQKTTHVTFVHAEGKPLIESLSNEIVSTDSNLNNILKGLELISITKNKSNQSENIKEKYFKYLENELGEIHFEGLPTDKEAGSVKVKLEDIFIPMNLSLIQDKKANDAGVENNKGSGIGAILSKSSKLAILARPGGGKSTLIKRIAIAYAFPARRKEINDNLPDKNWLPIFLRCRELGDNVGLSITEIISKIPIRAELNHGVEEFVGIVSEALQTGNALLLIDGLDEIADERNRIAFVNQLRTFIATYPTLNIVVSSRETGFRVVSGSLARYCDNYRISKLTPSEIEELIIKWHIAIIDNSGNTISEAKKLSEIIIRDNRIKVLAENPLLLTTLLFVKRWAGYLPTKKSVLYQEMIKLLLVTWNVEGHEQLDIEETEPQLAFIAYWMTKKGQQTITEEDLIKCLSDARKEMPEILGFTNIKPSEFVKRVESRSSLLIMSGHTKTDSGNISQVYEFLHLSFQEYLTAKAIVKKFIPQTDAKKSVVELLKPNIDNENWKEVIPIISVLLERNVKELIEYLISESKQISLKPRQQRTQDTNFAPIHLSNCLANEVQINPNLLEKAIEWVAKNNSTRFKATNENILKSKFGQIYRKTIRDLFFKQYDDKFTLTLGWALSDIYIIDVEAEKKESILEKIYNDYQANDRESKCVSILVLMEFSFSIKNKKNNEITEDKKIQYIFQDILATYNKNDLHYNLSVSWCVIWAIEANIFPLNLLDQYIVLFTKNWVRFPETNLNRFFSWALSKMLYPTLKRELISKIPKLKAKVNENIRNSESEFDALTFTLLSLILNPIITDEKRSVIRQEILIRRSSTNNNILEFAKLHNIPIDEAKLE